MTGASLSKVRWWWVRHAPVVEAFSKQIYGQRDVPVMLEDHASFEFLAKSLPMDQALWLVTPLSRTPQTADRIFKAAAKDPVAFEIEAAFTEQNFGTWQDKTWDQLADDPAALQFWQDVETTPPPGGESARQVMIRVHKAIRRLSVDHRGCDIVVVSHAGPIRAAVALALDLNAEAAMRLDIAPLSITRLDGFIDQDNQLSWAVRCLNARKLVSAE